jgi:hypothetical protein
MSENAVTIKYEPFKEVIVLELSHFSTPEDMARFTSVIAGGKSSGLYWADGVIFLYFPVSTSTESLAKELVEHKRVYWAFVGYSLMPKYQAVIETRDKMIVAVVDMSANVLMQKVASWLKEQK